MEGRVQGQYLCSPPNDPPPRGVEVGARAAQAISLGRRQPPQSLARNWTDEDASQNKNMGRNMQRVPTGSFTGAAS